MARMLTGRKGSSELKRAPNGRRTSSMNCCVLENFPDTADRPAISHVMSSAKMLATYPVPFAQERNASMTISRLELIAGLILPVSPALPVRRRLQREQLGVGTPQRHKLRMRPRLHHIAFAQHVDPVGRTHRREPVRDQQHRTVGEQLPDLREQLVL